MIVFKKTVTYSAVFSDDFEDGSVGFSGENLVHLQYVGLDFSVVYAYRVFFVSGLDHGLVLIFQVVHGVEELLRVDIQLGAQIGQNVLHDHEFQLLEVLGEGRQTRIDLIFVRAGGVSSLLFDFLVLFVEIQSFFQGLYRIQWVERVYYVYRVKQR